MTTGIVGADLTVLRQLVQRLGGPMRADLDGVLERMDKIVQDSTVYWIAVDGDKFRGDFESYVARVRTELDRTLEAAAEVAGQNLNAITQATSGTGQPATPPVQFGTSFAQPDARPGQFKSPSRQGDPKSGGLPPVQKVPSIIDGFDSLLREIGIAAAGQPWVWQRALTPAIENAQEAFRASRLEQLMNSVRLGKAATAFEQFTFQAPGMDGFASLSAISKVAVPLGLLMGGKELILGNGHSGAYSIADHVMGGVTVVGASAVLFGSVEAGLIGIGLLTPGVGWALLGAAGAYALGSWVWDNREAIGHFAESAWRDTSHLAESAWNDTTHAASGAVHAVGHLLGSILL